MKWLITFLHNDSSWEEVLVDGHRLSAAFGHAIALECPCHVLEVREVPDESVMYCWTEDGDPECCMARGTVFHGEECYHCARPIEGAGVALTSPDGEVYPLHEACAYKGCAGYDQNVVAAAVAEADGVFGWDENVVECEPLETLDKRVPVEPEVGDPAHATTLLEVGGARRWVVNGDPEEDWWAEVDDTGRKLPGDWEYNRDEGVVVCRFVPA